MTDRHKSFPGVLSDREAGSGLLGPRGAVRSTVSETPGKPKRKAIPAHVKVSVAIRQSRSDRPHWHGDGVVCPLCGWNLWEHEKRILEHMVPHATMTALGKDPDAIDNLAWVHAECAARKTNGTKATTAGSDKHMIAKGERFDKINRGERSRKRKGPPLKSRGFDRTFRKRMNGKVERV